MTSVGTAVFGGQPHSGVHPGQQQRDGVVRRAPAHRRRHADPTRRRGRRRGRTRTGRAARPAWARPEWPCPGRPPTAAHRRPHRRARTVATPRCCAPAHGWPTAAAPRRRPRRRPPRRRGCARNCTLPRDVNSSDPEPNSVASSASACNCAARDHAAGQPHPHQGAVGGLVHLQGARTGVLVAGAAHPFTVRRRR